MEGSMFYWICWIYWVLLTFFWEKQNPLRVKLAVTVLITIIVSNLHFSVEGFDVYVSGIFLLFLSYCLISKEKRGVIIYYFICSSIVTIAYVTFHLFEIYDPVWILFNKDWMIAICLSLLSLLLQKSLKGRLLIIVTGTMQGEFLYGYILSNYDFSYPIGSFSYLDDFMLTTAILVGWSALENAGVYFGNHFNQLGKTKQRSS